jgi:hypothetical protein
MKHTKLTFLIVLALVGVAACGGEPDEADERDLSLTPAESLATLGDQPAAEPAPESGTATPTPTRRRPAVPPPPPAPPTVASGTAMTLYARDTLKLDDNILGSVVAARIQQPMLDARGKEVIPSGAMFLGSFSKVEAEQNGTKTEVMVLTFDRVEIDGSTYSVAARTDSMVTRRQKGGVTAGDAAKVGAGAVVGAIAGRVLGGDKTGTIVGAVVGTAAGVGVAVATKGEEVILDGGSVISIVLIEPFVRQASM